MIVVATADPLILRKKYKKQQKRQEKSRTRDREKKVAGVTEDIYTLHFALLPVHMERRKYETTYINMIKVKLLQFSFPT